MRSLTSMSSASESPSLVTSMVNEEPAPPDHRTHLRQRARVLGLVADEVVQHGPEPHGVDPAARRGRRGPQAHARVTSAQVGPHGGEDAGVRTAGPRRGQPAQQVEHRGHVVGEMRERVGSDADPSEADRSSGRRGGGPVSGFLEARAEAVEVGGVGQPDVVDHAGDPEGAATAELATAPPNVGSTASNSWRYRP